MKNLLLILFIIISTLGCNNEENNSPEKKDTSIHYLKSSLGGCNSKTEENTEQREEKRDTTIFSFSQDTLNIYVGLNYICCAPFITDCTIKNDSIFISITDTCPNPNQCYCKCDCYYTFDYYFDGLSDQKYYWRITLIDPREKNEILFDDGVLEKIE